VIAVVLAFVMLASGCAFRAPRASLEPLSHDVSITDSLNGDGLLLVHHHSGGVRAAIIVGVCFIFIFVFLVDVFILWWSIPHHRPFCCCAYCVDWCR
jgi:hypothetical protein